jgi:antitoxin CptB
LEKSKSSWFVALCDDTHPARLRRFPSRGVAGGLAKPDPQRPREQAPLSNFFFVNTVSSSPSTDVQAVYPLHSGEDLDAPVSPAALSKLKWRTRRGMLENDLFIQRFFAKYEQQLTVRHANALNALMDLSDNELMDLHLARKTLLEIRPEFDTPDIQHVLNWLQSKS